MRPRSMPTAPNRLPPALPVRADALRGIVEDDIGLELLVVETARIYLERIDLLTSRISNLEKVLKSEARSTDVNARRGANHGHGDRGVCSNYDDISKRT